MKIVFSCFMLMVATLVCGQSENIISKEWESFEQIIDFDATASVNFKLKVTTKVDSEDKQAFSCLFALENTKDGESGFYITTEDKPVKTNKWQTIELNGTINANTENVIFGGYSFYNGLFYFDNFELYVEDENGFLTAVNIKNHSFEDTVTKNIIPNWSGLKNANGEPIKTKEFEVSTSNDAIHGKSSLLFKGRGIDSGNIGVIGEKDSQTPQIDNMISMLDDLKSRVVDFTQHLSQYKTDYLFDDKANSVGALIMHLAAAEALYQVVTFEGRGFNDEEKEKWQIALDLGQEAQEKYIGKEASYYINIYGEVREKTIKELKKRNDSWFQKIEPVYQLTNHYCWFHVMEHQSSHLGQILFLKKRIPPEGEINLPDTIKD